MDWDGSDDDFWAAVADYSLTPGYDRAANVLRDVLTHLDERVVAIRAGCVAQVFGEWAALCGVVGRRLRCASCEGRVQFIDTDGALVIQSEDGPKRVMLGEIVELEGS